MDKMSWSRDKVLVRNAWVKQLESEGHRMVGRGDYKAPIEEIDSFLSSLGACIHAGELSTRGKALGISPRQYDTYTYIRKQIHQIKSRGENKSTKQAEARRPRPTVSSPVLGQPAQQANAASIAPGIDPAPVGQDMATVQQSNHFYETVVQDGGLRQRYLDNPFAFWVARNLEDFQAIYLPGDYAAGAAIVGMPLEIDQAGVDRFDADPAPFMYGHTANGMVDYGMPETLVDQETAAQTDAGMLAWSDASVGMVPIPQASPQDEVVYPAMPQTVADTSDDERAMAFMSDHEMNVHDLFFGVPAVPQEMVFMSEEDV